MKTFLSDFSRPHPDPRGRAPARQRGRGGSRTCGIVGLRPVNTEHAEVRGHGGGEVLESVTRERDPPRTQAFGRHAPRAARVLRTLPHLHHRFTARTRTAPTFDIKRASGRRWEEPYRRHTAFPVLGRGRTLNESAEADRRMGVLCVCAAQYTADLLAECQNAQSILVFFRRGQSVPPRPCVASAMRRNRKTKDRLRKQTHLNEKIRRFNIPSNVCLRVE